MALHWLYRATRNLKESVHFHENCIRYGIINSCQKKLKNLKLILILAFLSLLTTCNKNNIDIKPPIESFVYTLYYKDRPDDAILRTEYTLEKGMVIAEKYTYYSNPVWDYESTFEYDSIGRIIREVRNNKLFTEVVWLDNVATYSYDSITFTNFTFNDQFQLIKYGQDGYNTYLDYEDGNIVAKRSNTRIIKEYLDYDKYIENPFYLLKSIQILRLLERPHFKNLFKTMKVYPFVEKDVSHPLMYYEFYWTLNSQGLVETLSDDLSSIYIKKFEYNYK